MANKTDTTINSAFLNAEIEPEKIFESVIEIAQSLRSSDPANPGHIPKRSDENLGSEDGESMFNAILRAIGLPAAREDSLIIVSTGNKATNNEKSQLGTINYFQQESIFDQAGEFGSVIKREQALAAIRPLDIQPSATKENIAKGLQFMLQPIFPDAGISGLKNRRVSIFPLAVCGDVTVFPLSSRIMPMFSSSGAPGGYQQQRSFLEFVIKTRLTAAKSEQKSDLISNIKQKILGIGVATNSVEPDPLKNKKEAIIKNIENEEIFSLRVIQKILQSIEASAEKYARTLESVRSYMQDVSYVPSFNGRSPFVMQGNFDITYEDQIKALDEYDPNLKNTLGLMQKPRIDAAISDLELKKAEADKFFDLFLPVKPQKETEVEDDIDFFNGASSGSAFGTGTFEDIIVQICTIDRNSVDEELKRKITERDRIRQELEILRSKLDVYSGYTYGISIFDFLAIILSLYTMPTTSLVGLLNPEGLERAKKALGMPFEEIEQNIPKANACLSTLNESVKQILNIARAAFDKAQKGSK